MRVIGGKYRSRKLRTLKGDATRPTADKIKGAIFNSIAFETNYNIMLDLFSGSGAMGIEGISRGFKYVYFNDSNKQAVNVIKNNLKDLELIKNIEVYNLDYKDVIRVISKKTKVDFIFVDPPYDKIKISDILKAINKYDVVQKQGIVCVETSTHHKMDENYGTLKKYKEKTYKTTTITYYRKEE